MSNGGSQTGAGDEEPDGAETRCSGLGPAGHTDPDGGAGARIPPDCGKHR